MKAVGFNQGSVKLWIFAGEPSGDLYGAHLARELHALRPGVEIGGMGGGHMRRAGVELFVDSTDLAVVGVVEVLRRLSTFRRVFGELVRRAEAERPAAVVLIDYPGFNLRFARRMKQIGVPVIYYVSPQVWAWGTRRIPHIARTVDRMLVIFPFELQTYAGVDLDVRFVGHPLVDILTSARPGEERTPELVALLPGSRDVEVRRLTAPLLATAQALFDERPRTRFVVPAPNAAIARLVRGCVDNARLPADFPLQVVVGETEVWMRRAGAGIAASGTVTVQAAILGLPLVVVYHVNPFTFALGRLLVDLPCLTMVNLVTGETVFEEFLQREVTPSKLLPAVRRILPEGPQRAAVEAGMECAVRALGGRRNASRQAAVEVLDCLGLPPVGAGADG